MPTASVHVNGNRAGSAEKDRLPSQLPLCHGKLGKLEENAKTNPAYSSQHRNSKSEYRNPKQIRNSKKEKRKHARFRISNFGFVSDFDIRVSDFDCNYRLTIPDPPN